MARARNIKPSIMDNEDLAELAPITRLLFIYLWMLADREGRLEDRPKRIAAQALAYDRQANVSEMLSSLESSGFVTRYTANGMAIIQINAFSKHQSPHIRESASALPSIEQSTTKAVPSTNQGNDEALPRSPDSLIPDSLIPDSLINTPTVATPIGSAAVFELPAWIPPETWAAYCKTRSGKRAKNEPHALGLIVADLEKFKAAGHDPVEILNNSIKSGWAGVFEPKQQPAGKPGYQSIHEQRANTIAILTGKKSHERTTADERDITGESCRVAG